MIIRKLSRLLFLISIPVGLGLSACGEKKTAKIETDHKEETAEKHESEKESGGHDDHGAEASGASYEEGKGISLSEETQKAMKLEVAEVGEQDLEPSIRLTAQVYRSASEASRSYGKERSGNAYATALVSKELIEQMTPGQKITFLPKGESGETHNGSVLRVDTAQLPILGKGEALLELPDAEKTLPVGAFVEAHVILGKEPKKVLGVPKSAVLETSTGKYAFVKNGNFLLRTEIKTGAQNEDYIEITEGLYEGDTIALKPVEALYLIELRATKGGGHSH